MPKKSSVRYRYEVMMIENYPKKNITYDVMSVDEEGSVFIAECDIKEYAQMIADCLNKNNK